MFISHRLLDFKQMRWKKIRTLNIIGAICGKSTWRGKFFEACGRLGSFFETKTILDILMGSVCTKFQVSRYPLPFDQWVWHRQIHRYTRKYYKSPTACGPHVDLINQSKTAYLKKEKENPFTKVSEVQATNCKHLHPSQNLLNLPLRKISSISDHFES